ncbi:FAD-binding protein, partial [Marinicrinis lubricantis]
MNIKIIHTSLKKMTTIHIGPDLRCFATANTLDEVKELLRFAKTNKLKINVIGNGSNLLIGEFSSDILMLDFKLDTENRECDNKSIHNRGVRNDEKVRQGIQTSNR